jgi:hypothetical protein
MLSGCAGPTAYFLQNNFDQASVLSCTFFDGILAWNPTELSVLIAILNLLAAKKILVASCLVCADV